MPRPFQPDSEPVAEVSPTFASVQVCSIHSRDPVFRKARFLQGLSNAEQNDIVQAARSQRYAVNSVVQEQGNRAD